MPISNQKKFLVLSGALLFASFLFFIPQRTYAADPLYTAGYYRDNGTDFDNSCNPGNWRAYVEVKDYAGNPLVADTIIIQAIYYQLGGEGELTAGEVIYGPETVTNATSFETLCQIPIRESPNRMVLEIEVIKDGYYDMKAANNVKYAGGWLDKKKWSKTLYLASTSTSEANISFLSPEYDQWLTAPTGTEMKVGVNNTPLSDGLDEIEIKLRHKGTGIENSYSASIIPNIDRGEISFPIPNLNEIGLGEYVWRVTKLKNSAGIFYNEKEESSFNFDPYLPSKIYASYYKGRSGKQQNVNLYAEFEDIPTPSSGLHKFEFYINDGNGGEPQLIESCTGILNPPVTRYRTKDCSATAYKEYLVTTTYKWYIIAYDYAGNKTKVEGTCTIEPLVVKQLTVYSYFPFGGGYLPGVDFEVIDVNPIGAISPSAPVPYTTTTVKKFDIYDDFTIALRSPISTPVGGGSRFSYWQTCSNSRDWNRSYSFGYDYSVIMNFGVSKLMIGNRQMPNAGIISEALRTYLRNKKTRIRQISGTPVFAGGFVDETFDEIVRTVGGPIENLTLEFNDSEDGILKFNYITNNPYCVPDTGNRCSGSIDHVCGSFIPHYLVQRTVRVETYLGSNPVGGVVISGDGGMPSVTTNEEGYYPFSSTGTIGEFSGTLEAPDPFIDNDDKKWKFTKWYGGCEDKEGLDDHYCYIGATTWYENVTTTVIALYSEESESATPELSVNVQGTGTVESDIGDICCGCATTDCSDHFTTGTSVTLTATPAPNYYFVGWTDACSGTNLTCNPTIENFDKSVGAEFKLKPVLTVNITGNGTVTSTPPDIDCDGPTPIPSTCSTYFDLNEDVELTANPDSNWEFIGWTGDCSGTGDCFLTIDEDKTVTATFKIKFSPPTGLEESPDYCWGNPLPVAPGTAIIFSWVYDPVHVYPQGAYEIWISDGINSATTTHTSLSSNYVLDLNDFGNWKDTQCDHSVEFPTFGKGLCWDGTYYWKVKVKDNLGNWSNFSNQSSFEMPAHAWPWIDFSWTPERPTVDEIVYFTDLSEAFGGAVKSNWDWNFQDGNPLTSNLRDATTTFTSIGSKNVTLTVTDSDNFSCYDSKDIQIAFSLPKWKEVPPIF